MITVRLQIDHRPLDGSKGGRTGLDAPPLALNATVSFNKRVVGFNKRMLRLNEKVLGSVADLLFYSAASSGTSLIKV